MRRKWLLASLLAVVLLPVLLVGVVLVYVSTAGLDQHRGLVADHISKIIGRRLRINGALELNLDSTTSLVVKGVTLANADWATAPEMLSIQRFEAEIKILPLFQGDVQIPRIHVEGVRASLETDAGGNGNWVLTQPVGQAAPDDTAKTAAVKRPWIGDLYISDVEIAYRDAANSTDIHAILDHAKIRSEMPTSPVTLDIAAKINGNTVNLNGQLALPAMMSTDRLDVPIELHARVLDLKADAKGSIRGSVKSPAIQLRLQAEADSLAQMKRVFGDAVPDVTAVRLNLQVSGDQGQPLSFTVVTNAGEASLQAEFKLVRERHRPRLTGSVFLNDLDVTRLWAPMLAARPAGEKVARTGATEAKATLQLDRPLDFSWVDSLDADVNLAAKRVNLPQVSVKSLKSRLLIDDRRIRVGDMELQTEAGSVTTSLSVNARQKQAAVELDLKAWSVLLGKLPFLEDNDRFEHSRANVEISVRSEGETAADLVERLLGGVEITYDDRRRNEKLSLSLTREAQQETADRTRLVVAADGSLNDQAIEIRGHVIPPADLLGSDKPYDIKLVLKGFGVIGEVAGTAAAPYRLDGVDVSVKASADNLKALRKSFGKGIPDIGKTELETRFEAGRSKMKFSSFRLVPGQGHIDGWFVLDTSASIPALTADLAFADLDIDSLLPAQDQPAKAEETGAAKSRPGKVFPNEPLPFEMLSRATVNATLQAVNIEFSDRRLQQAKVRLMMDRGRLSASLLELSSVKGDLVGELVVDAGAKAEPDISIQLKVPEIELAELLVVDNGKAAVRGPLAVDIDLKGNGSSVAQIMATLNGNVKLLMQQGSADAKALDVFVGGLSAMFGTIFTENSSKTRIECALSDLKLEQGMLTPRLAVLDTQYSTVIAEGQVDLKQERLDLKVSPQAKGVTLSVAFPVQVKGTLAKPSVEVEKTGALLKAGELWATVVYPPAALVKFSDLGGGKNNPCVTMVAEKAGIPIVEDVGKAVKGVVKGTGNVIKGVGSGVGKLLGGSNMDEAESEAGSNVDSDQGTGEDVDDPDLFMDY